MLDLSIVIVNFNTARLTLECLESIYANQWQCKYEVVLVDNGSTEPIAEAVKQHFPQVKFITSSTNLGFTGGNNLGLKAAAESHYYLLLNSDTKVLAGSLDQLLQFADQHQAGIASCLLVDGSDNFQSNGGDLPTVGPMFNWLSGLDDIGRKLGVHLASFHRQRRADFINGQPIGWVQGSAMLISAAVLQRIGLLDERIFMYCEDVDYCWRAKEAGFKVLWTDQAKIIHYGGASSKDPRASQWLGEFRGLIYLYQKHYGFGGVVSLRILFSIFISLRVLMFALLGKFHYAKTYVQILSKI